MKWFFQAWKRTFNIKGRARRKEYWYFHLINSLIFTGIVLLGVFMGLGKEMEQDKVSTFGMVYGVISVIFMLAIFIPTITVTIRRLHDTSHSAWWLILPILIQMAVGFVTGIIASAVVSFSLILQFAGIAILLTFLYGTLMFLGFLFSPIGFTIGVIVFTVISLLSMSMLGFVETIMSLVYLIAPIIEFIFMIKDGNEGENRYGLNPKHEEYQIQTHEENNQITK